MSVVYEATSKKSGDSFAVKKIEKNIMDDKGRDLVFKEVEIMKGVEHKGVLKLYEIFEDNDSIYIVMELIEGCELFDRIVEKGFYTERDAITIVKQLIEAIEYLHARGIAHRDLKPENLLCEGTGDGEIVKICDFGLSKIVQNEEEFLSTSVGTPGYVAPEVLLCETYDISVDMWGIGVITFVLLSGYPPFYDGSGDPESDVVIEKVIGVEYDFDDECWEDVSDLAKDFVSKLLVRSPDERMSAPEALQHEWLNSAPSKTDLSNRISRRISEYNFSRRKTNQNTRDNLDVAALNRM
eukprot:TRINITY_DN0_c0_g1_i1.p1 TRINITY_DN0_c0_g1~~TRINITY_DN0_c0_g1_i1.p1  ORF type:complete len:296 (-),score=71.16 TRINITY_DN0_c0_g1_i1:44-931(-)